jgi:hypothetical protein
VSVQVQSAYQRAYGADGREEEVSAGMMRKVSTGYLSSSYKSVAERPSSRMDVATVHAALGATRLAQLSGWQAVAGAPDRVEVWGDEDALLQLDLQDGDQVRHTLADGV